MILVSSYSASFTQRNPTVAFLSNEGETRSKYCLKFSSRGPPCTYQKLDVGKK